MDPRLRSIGPRRGVRHRGTRQGPTDCGGRRAPLLGRSVRHRPAPPCPPRFHRRCVDESISRSVHETQDTLGDEASGTEKNKTTECGGHAFDGILGPCWKEMVSQISAGLLHHMLFRPLFQHVFSHVQRHTQDLFALLVPRTSRPATMWPCIGTEYRVPYYATPSRLKLEADSILGSGPVPLTGTSLPFSTSRR